MVEQKSIGYEQGVCGKLYACLPHPAFYFFAPQMKRERKQDAYRQVVAGYKQQPFFACPAY